MGKRLTRSFYTRSSLVAAGDLLGKYIVRKIGGKKLVGKIVETEAYIGPQDKASHAYLGKRTPRNEAEFLVGGHIYIYLVYGMYWQLNISTAQSGKPECVLIRALEPILDGLKNPKSKILISNSPAKIFKENLGGQEPQISNNQNFKKIRDLANGPGKLCRWMKLDKSFYGEDLTKSKRIWLAASISSRRASPKGREDRGEKIPRSKIAAAPRIGIDYAGPVWAKKPWRFYIKNNPFVSKY